MFREAGRIGPYRLDEELGSGASGIVYRGRDEAGQPAAIKILHPQLVDENVRRRFQREAEVAIDHPNVVQILDQGLADDGRTPWIAFELLTGQSFEARLQAGPIDLADLVELAVQACRGLAAAHERGLIHRDLKPANLFVCRDGTLKILDFGMALATDRATRLTRGDAILGTPAYLSPEQARGDQELDAQTDVWALGAILYEALSGEPPFARDTVFATIVAIRMDRLVPLLMRVPRVPTALAAAIERALRKEPERRWPSALAFAEALQQADLTPGVPITGEHDVLGAPAENRVVAVVLGERVHAPEVFEHAIAEGGGLSITLVGDRALGLFGADRWEGDEVRRAVDAALAVRSSAHAVAVASGRATVAGSVVSGAVLNAAEIGCAAALHGVAVDGETARAVRDSVSLRPVGPDLWETGTGAHPAVPDLVATPEDGPILGREAELAALRRAMETATDEQRSLAVLVRGSPGIGRSRLLRAIPGLAAEQLEPPVVLRGRAEPHRRQSAFALVASVLRNQLAAVGAGTDERSARVALGDLVRSALDGDPRAPACEDFLAELLGLSVHTSVSLSAARRDPQLMADRLRLAVFDYVDGLSSSQPVVLVLDDLQWADAASLDLMEELLERLADRPLVVVGAARPELEQARPDLFSGGEVEHVALKGLSVQHVATLSRFTLGAPLPERLVRAIAQHTSGNPLFVEQIGLALRDAGPLESKLDELPLPLTVQAAVQSRLDHLPAIEKQLCKHASIMGRDFIGEEIAALGVTDPETHLASLCRRNVMVVRGRARLDRGRQYRFKSSLVADVAYRMLSDELREALHQRMASYLTTREDYEPEEVAAHSERGGDSEKAARYYVEAALAAVNRGDADTVLRCSGRALTQGAPEEQRFRLRMARADALRFRRRRDDQGEELARAEALAASDEERARVLTEKAVWLARGGEHAEAARAVEGAVQAARTAGNPQVLALALGRQVSSLSYAGRFDDAERALTEATTLAEALGPQLRALAAEWRAQLAAAKGDLGERRLAFEEAAARYIEAGDLRLAAGAEVNLADVYNRFGAYHEAERELHRAIESCRRVRHRQMEGYALLNLGYSLGMLGNCEESLGALDETAALAQEMREARLLVAARCYRARVLVEAGRFGEANAAARAAAEEAVGASMPTLEVMALTAWARALLALAQMEEAVETGLRALELRDELGSIEEDEVEVFLVCAQALLAAGRDADAADIRRRGLHRLRELADQIADPRWRERFLDDVPAHRAIAEDDGAA